MEELKMNEKDCDIFTVHPPYGQSFEFIHYRPMKIFIRSMSASSSDFLRLLNENPSCLTLHFDKRL